jgi:hypothetical protein
MALKIRNPNVEIPNKFEIQLIKIRNGSRLEFYAFDILHCFEFHI